MTVEKLERVMWRIRKLCPDTKMVPYRQLELAIMLEIGTDKSTYKRNKRALLKLGWIKGHTTNKCCMTNKDLTDT